LLIGGAVAVPVLILLVVGLVLLLVPSRKPDNRQVKNPPDNQPIVSKEKDGEEKKKDKDRKKDGDRDEKKDKDKQPLPPPINDNGGKGFVKGKEVAGRVGAFLDNSSFLTHIGPFIKQRGYPDGEEIAAFEGHKDRVHALTLSRDGKRMASCDEGKNVLIWEVKTRKVLKQIKAKEIVRSVAFSPDGKSLAGGGSPTVYLWEADTGNEVSSYTGKRSAELILQVGFSPDGSQVASGGQTFRVWTIRDGGTAMETGPLGGVMKFAASRDGGHYHLATSYRYLWLKTEGSIMKLREGSTPLLEVVFTPDHRRLLVGGSGLIALADPETGELIDRLPMPANQNWQAVVAPNGRFLAAVGSWGDKSQLVEYKGADSK
jgi:WD40 repeat protein